MTCWVRVCCIWLKTSQVTTLMTTQIRKVKTRINLTRREKRWCFKAGLALGAGIFDRSSVLLKKISHQTSWNVNKISPVTIIKRFWPVKCNKKLRGLFLDGVLRGSLLGLVCGRLIFRRRRQPKFRLAAAQLTLHFFE